jgi:hypothetical protein
MALSVLLGNLLSNRVMNLYHYTTGRSTCFALALVAAKSYFQRGVRIARYNSNVKSAPCFQRLGSLMIAHSGSNRSYFAQFVHSGRKNERLELRRI